MKVQRTAKRRPENKHKKNWAQLRREITDICGQVATDFGWPKHDFKLLVWLATRLEINRFLREVQEAEFDNEAFAPRNRYLALKARLMKALDQVESAKESLEANKAEAKKKGNTK